MSINIRKVTEAVIQVGQIETEHLADGAVTEPKIATEAVTTAKIGSSAVTEVILSDAVVVEAKIGSLAVTTDKLAVDAVTDERLADDAVDTASLKNAAVTLAKSADDVRLHQFAGEESEVFLVGTDYVSIKEANIFKRPWSPATALRFIADLKTGTAPDTAYIAFNVNGTQELELTSNSEVYEIVEGTFDFSGYSPGKHLLKVSMKSDNIVGTAWNDMIDILIVK